MVLKGAVLSQRLCLMGLEFRLTQTSGRKEQQEPGGNAHTACREREREMEGKREREMLELPHPLLYVCSLDVAGVHSSQLILRRLQRRVKLLIKDSFLKIPN